MPFVGRPDTRIHYTVTGSGPAIILGHSFLCSGDMWAHQVAALAASHTVINVDARGHGRSEPAPPGSTLHDMLGDMLAVLDDAGVERAIWAGLSMGGMVAMRAALDVPERVEALLLLDTDAGAEHASVKMKYRLLLAVARLMGVRPALGPVMKLMFGTTTLSERGDLAAEYRKRFVGVHVPSIVNLAPGIYAREDIALRLSDLAVPALVLVGTEDRALPPERSRHLAEALPGARLVEVAGAGHLSALERPDEVTEIMLDFLSDLRSA